MYKHLSQRILSVFIVLALVLQMVPVQILATESGNISQPVLSEKAEATPVLESAQIVEEMTEKRTEFSKQFRMSNGLYMAVLYADPVHYAQNGQWKEIDNTLKLSDSAYINTAGGWEISLPQQLSKDKAVSVTKDGYTLRFQLAGQLLTEEGLSTASAQSNKQAARVQEARTTQGKVQQIDLSKAKAAAEYPETVSDKLRSRLQYNDIYADTDIIYDLTSNQLKESILMDAYNASLQGYRYILETGDMTPVLTDSGRIELYGADKATPIMVMPAPYLVDDGGEYCYDVAVELTGKGGSYVLTYGLPDQWLASKDRQWPVILDPVVTTVVDTNNIQDITLYQRNAYPNYQGGVLECGYTGSYGISRAFLKYVDLPDLTSSDVIISANLRMYLANTTSSSNVIEVRKVNQNWENTTMNWSNQPSIGAVAEDYACAPTSGLFYHWDITDIVQGWYRSGNTGLAITAPQSVENGTTNVITRFWSSDYSIYQVDEKPAVTIVFRNNNGLESYWNYTSASAGRAGTGYVNQYTGNLVWTHTDIGFGGNRMPVSISHVYNLNDIASPSDNNNANDSAGNAFGMGTGWRTNFNQLLYRWQVNGLAQSYYVWEDADGTDHYFCADSSGVLRDEDGLELTLTTNGSGTEVYCITDKYGNKTYFDSLGRLSKLSNNQFTKSSISVSYTDSSGKLISTVTDGAGRVYSFAYSGGLLSRISYKGTGSTVLSYVDFTYSGTQLTRITDKDGKYSSFGYTTSNLLLSAQDVDGYKLDYSYHPVSAAWQPYRVLSVCEYDDDIEGGQLNFSYGHNQTTVTDHNGNKEILQFNDFGNLTGVQDDEGRAQFSQYTFNTDKQENSNTSNTKKVNQLTASSRLQNTVGNRLENSSFETGIAGWTSTGNAGLVAAQNAVNAYHGTKSLSFTRTAASGQKAGVYTSLTAEAKSSYTFSVYVKSGDIPVTLYAEENGIKYIKGETLPANSDWTRLQVHYTNSASSSATVRLMVVSDSGAGTGYVDCAQFEKSQTASRYNLMENGDFTGTGYWSSSSGRTTGSAAAPELSGNVYQLTGNPAATNRLTQTVYVAGNANDSFVLGGWAKADSVPLDSFGTNARAFGLMATFHHTDGTTSSTTVSFNPSIGGAAGWQYAAAPIVASKAYSSITVALAYDYNANTALFDGIQLYKEEFGSSYTYDANGNVTAVKDVQAQTTRYEYVSNNLTKQILPTGAELSYTYDSYHNVKTATTEEGLLYSFTYDGWGNNTAVSVTAAGSTMTATAAYTTDGNRLASTQDALGNTTTYSYNADTNMLEWVQYPEDTAATRTNYTYDSMYRVATVAATVNTGGTMQVQYTYANDRLSAVTTPSTTYSFTYGSFGLASSVKIGSRTLASYSYTDDRNFYLSALDYGNGDRVQYSYDDKGRVVSATYEDGDTVKYTYDNSGALATVKDSSSGITTTYYYDFTDRMMKCVETAGSYYYHSVGYTYDAINNLTAMVENINGVTRTTGYSYDDDNRITGMTTDGISRTYTYDGLGRVTQQASGDSDGAVVTKSYTYTAPTATTTSGQIATVRNTAAGYDVTYTYTYDKNGNILSVSDGTYTTTYEYDSANQLIRETNPAGNFIRIWYYDNAGNISYWAECEYEAEYLSNAEVEDRSCNEDDIGYVDSDWGDLLSSRGYESDYFSYDEIGNTLYDVERSYTWEHGRELCTVTQDGVTWFHTYNADGLRTARWEEERNYEYVYTDGQLQCMEYNGTPVYFTHAPDGTPVSMTTGGQTYYYITNLQGDIVAILDSTGNPVVQYTYDAWGRHLSTTGTLAATIGTLNPLRYRGYVYDVETGLYYLQSRYYNPELGRFINADAFVSTGQGFVGNNMFAYCGNNPVIYVDPRGLAAYHFPAQFLGGGMQNKVVPQYINDQSNPEIGNKMLGLAKVSHSGCGPIAVHNALLAMGVNSNFDQIINYYSNTRGALDFWGIGGSSINAMVSYFEESGYTVYLTSDPTDMDIYSLTADGCVLYYEATSNSIPFYNAHFMAYSRNSSGYTYHNFPISREAYTYKDFARPSDFGCDYKTVTYVIGIYIYK